MKLGLFSILAISITSLQLYGIVGEGKSTPSQQNIVCAQINRKTGQTETVALTTRSTCQPGWTELFDEKD